MTSVVNTNCPFTLTEYRYLLRLAKGRFPLVGYDDYQRYESFVIWRHDVEYCVPEMSVLAQIDAEEGVTSTLFIQLHSDLYNFWDPATAAEIKQWLAWGHKLGLHFDCAYYGDEVFENIDGILTVEKELLERIFDTPVTSFAYHNPTVESLLHQDNYGGLVNAYNTDFSDGPIVYVSDSNGRWRERTVRDVLKDPHTTKAQVNTHDTWWSEDRIPQIRKLERAITRDAQRKLANHREHANIVVEDII